VLPLSPGRLTAAAVFLALAAGCGTPPQPSGHTGAEEAARGYFDAVLHKDWQRAYAALHPDTRKRYSGEQFARLAQKYRQGLGFEPQEVKLRSCEEHGNEAVAHVLLVGQQAAKQRTFKEAVTLRQTPGGWAVVLPPGFGEAR
jgi:hypothetical protein